MYAVLVALNDITCTLEADNLEQVLEAATTSVNSQSLKNSVSTRWNSTLGMNRCFTDNFDTINICLLKISKSNLAIFEMEKLIIIERIYSKISTQETNSEFGIVVELFDFAKNKQFYK